MKVCTLFLLVVAVSSSLSTHAAVDPRRFVRSTKEDATLSLTLVCSREGVFSGEERIFYFRPPRDTADLGATSITDTHADRATGGVGLTATADPRDADVEVKVIIQWTEKTTHRKSTLTMVAQYFENQKGKMAGFEYSLVWKKLK